MVYLWAFLYYIFKFRGNYDLIIDCENGIPFFTPIYANVPVIGLVHHVHQEIFRTQLSLPFAKVAQFLEGTLMPLVYRNSKIITVSNSSKKDLEKLGFSGEIDVINPGVNLTKFGKKKKTIHPQLVYLGRLKPYKSIDTLIFAMVKVASKFPNVKLNIAGAGESESYLKSLTEMFGLKDIIRFLGRVTEIEKHELLGSSWLAVQPSMMEGWGITAIEANASGTPVVAANVAGLRDSVKNPHSGILFPWGDVDALALTINNLIENTPFRKNLEVGAMQWASNFTWEKSTNSFYEQVISELRKAESKKFVDDFAIAGREQI